MYASKTDPTGSLSVNTLNIVAPKSATQAMEHKQMMPAAMPAMIQMFLFDFWVWGVVGVVGLLSGCDGTCCNGSIMLFCHPC
jgi:hypothetical protein